MHLTFSPSPKAIAALEAGWGHRLPEDWRLLTVSMFGDAYLASPAGFIG